MNENYSKINDTLLLDYLQKFTSVAENGFIEDWIADSEDNTIQFEKVKRLWKVTSMTEDFDNLNVDTSWQKVATRIKEKENPKVRKIAFSMLWKVAAVLILFLGIAVPFFFNNNTTLIADTTKEFLLPDGTQVWLKKGSQLTYENDFNSETRDVVMNGEGFFNVQKNIVKPFTIKLNNTKTTVLGTQFNLKSDIKNNVSLVLIEGSVKFSNKENFKIIKPGETITNLPDGTLSIKTTENINFDSWKTKKLQFDKTELSKAIADIENTYGVKIIIENKAINTCKITSTFTNQSIDEIVETLTLLYQFSVVKQEGVIRLINGECRF